MSESATDASAAVELNKKPRLSLGRKILYSLLVYVCFVLILAAVEVGVRLTRPHISSLSIFVTTAQQKAQVADAKQSTIFEGDPLLLWRLKPNLDHVVWDYTVVTTNAEHLRSDRPLAAKQPGTIRIVCVGDSVTFGFRVPAVWPERPNDYDATWLPFPMLLEKQMQEANPNRKIEVVNLAVPGYTSHQGLAWLRRDIDRLQPDLITISFGWNDASVSDVPDREAIKTSWYAVGVRWLIDHSQAFAHATAWLRSRPNAAAPKPTRPRPRVSLGEYLRNMMAMVELARERKVSVIVIGAPYRDRSPQAPEGMAVSENRVALRQMMEQQQVPYLEVRELTEDAYPSNMGWFGERIHPNHMGHRLMAAELLKLMAARQLLKDLTIPSLTP